MGVLTLPLNPLQCFFSPQRRPRRGQEENFGTCKFFDSGRERRTESSPGQWTSIDSNQISRCSENRYTSCYFGSAVG
jgi:hypothetical protein